MERDLLDVIQKVQAHLDPAMIDQDPTVSLSTKLHRAQKTLKKAKHEADQLHQQHLNKLLNEAVAANHVKQSKVLKYLIWAERNWQCYAWFHHHMKPKVEGGLAFVMVTASDGTQQPLLEHADIEDTLLKYSRTHFATTEGLTFTCEPLKWLLQYDGITKFGDYVYQGHDIQDMYDFDKPTTAILKNLRNKIPQTITTDHPLDYNLLMNGIKKWPEKTTTSPSGCHLGIYKTLQKHIVKQKKKNNNANMDLPDQLGPIKQGHDILFLIFNIMTLALKHTYPLQ